MRLSVNILHILRLEKLIEGNRFLQRMLADDGHGGWWIEDEREASMAELKRLLAVNRIKYSIK